MRNVILFVWKLLDTSDDSNRNGLSTFTHMYLVFRHVCGTKQIFITGDFYADR